MRRRNLFTGEKSYSQLPTLCFAEAPTETRCAQERFRFAQISTHLWQWCLAVAVALAWGCEVVGLPQALTALGLLWVAGRVRGWLQRRVAWALADVWVGYIFSTPSDSWTFTDSLFALFPGFLINLFLLRHWSQGLLASVAEGCILTMFVPVGCGQLVAPVMLWTSVAAFLEKDQRDLWTLGDSYKRSEQHYEHCFNGALEAVFIVRFDGRVLHCNFGAKNLRRQITKPGSDLSKIQSLFQDENSVKIKDMLEAAAKGETDEKELILKKLPMNCTHPEELKGLGLQIRSQPLLWKRDRAVMLTCEDVSLYISRRVFLASIYKQLHSSVLDFSEEMESLHYTHSMLDARSLHRFHCLSNEYGNALILQFYVLGRAELKKEGFNARSEVENVMELSSLQASDSKVDLLLTREDGFPTSVCGDKIKHEKLLNNILAFAISNAKPRSEVSLLCSVEGPMDTELWLGYRLTFKPEILQKEDMDRLLLTRKQEAHRRTLQDVMTLSNKHGLGIIVFDALLLMMRGYVASVTQNMLELSISIKFQLPFSQLSSEIRGTPLFVSSLREEVNGQTMRWKCTPAGIHPSVSAPNLIMKKIIRRSEDDGSRSQFSKFREVTKTPLEVLKSESSDSFSDSVSEKMDGEVLPPRLSEWSEIGISDRGSVPASREDSRVEELLSSRHIKTRKILIVDSNPYRRKVLKTEIIKLGYSEFDEAKDDTEAMQMYRVLSLQKSVYLVVFADLEHAVAIGLALLRKIRETEVQHSTRRTFLCGICDTSDVPDGLLDARLSKVRLSTTLQGVLQSALAG